MKTAIIARAKRTYSLMWFKMDKLQHLKPRNNLLAYVILLILMIGLIVFGEACLQPRLESYLSVNNRVEGFQSLFLGLGSALITAAAIAFSLILFAMQVNVERMPHGLFRKLSADKRILASTVGTIIIAIIIASASLVSDASWLAAACLSSTWGVALTMLLFLHAYQRALALINPLEQLSFIVKSTDREMKIWDTRARRAASLLQPTDPADSTHDLPRMIFFHQLNPHWTDGAREGIEHAMSFAGRFAEHGDHEVAVAALKTIVTINTQYIRAKGNTFVASNPFIEDPQSTDVFINNTLEHLRKYVRDGIARRDERQIELAFRALTALVGVYSGIDYSSTSVPKDHAHLAAAYLSDAVNYARPHDMADVLMEGLRCMGTSTAFLLVRSHPEGIIQRLNEIADIANAGLTNQKYLPVTLTAVEQLADMTYKLIFQTDASTTQSVLANLSNNVTGVSKRFLEGSDNQTLNPMAPYYSGETRKALLPRLADLVNALVNSDRGDTAAKAIIRNIEGWAYQLAYNARELLPLTATRRDYAGIHFTVDLKYWIVKVTEILLAVSNASACDDHTRDGLRDHAYRLIATLSSQPDDYVNTTEKLFEIAMFAYYQDCHEFSDNVRSLLLRRIFKGETGRFSTAMLGLATLALVAGPVAVKELKEQVSHKLSLPDAPGQEIRDKAAGEIRKIVANPDYLGHHSPIKSQMDRMDRAQVQTLLEELSELLAPGGEDT